MSIPGITYVMTFEPVDDLFWVATGTLTVLNIDDEAEGVQPLAAFTIQSRQVVRQPTRSDLDLAAAAWVHTMNSVYEELKERADALTNDPRGPQNIGLSLG